MKLQCLILLTLFVHNSWAYSLYDEIDDNDLWRREDPSTHKDSPECKKDILVLWDNSNSIGNKYTKVFEFIKRLIRSKTLNVGKDGTHIGFITFSGPPSEKYRRPGETKKDDRTRVLLKVGEYTDKEKIIDNLTQYDYKYQLSGGATHTGTAFKLAMEEFKERSPKNHRDGIDDVILLFTDGQPNPDYLNKKRRNKKGDQTGPANKISRSFKERNITIIGLAVETQVSVTEFRPYIKKWASPKLVFEAKVEKLDNVIGELVAASCKTKPAECECKGIETAKKEYIKEGEKTLQFRWEKPTVTCNEEIEETRVTPAGARSPMEYGPGKHNIAYTFLFKNKERKSKTCVVGVDVGVCGCPPSQTLEAEIQEGDTRAYLSWSEPVPQPCNTVVLNRPQTSGWFCAGKHRRTYSYKHTSELHSFEIQCHVDIVVKGQFCGGMAYNPDTHVCCSGKARKKESGDVRCCGQDIYKPTEKICCPDDSIVSIEEGCRGC